MAFVASSGIDWASRASTPVPVPAGAATDQIAVVDLHVEWATGTVTPPSGFTLDTSVTMTGATAVLMYGYRYWKRLTGADSGTYDFGTSATIGTNATCTLWSGRITSGSPFDTSTGATSTISGPNGSDAYTTCPDAPSITPTVAGCDLLYGAQDWAASLTAATVTAGWTINPARAGQLNAYKVNQAASASGVVAVATISDRWTAELSALLPAPPAGVIDVVMGNRGF